MKNVFDLSGKKAVVIGGGGGIGAAIAKGLAFYGADVAITGRRMNVLEAARDSIYNETGKEVICLTADATDEDSLKALYKAANDKLGQVDILVNSQGYNKKFPVEDFPLDVWNGMLATNVTSVMMASRIFAEGMKERHFGRIINVSSIRAIRAVNQSMGNSCYCTTKGALDMLTKSLASEWSRTGITVNAIGPVITMTEMMVPIFEQNPAMKDSLVANIPMGRMGEVDDNIAPAVFLASEGAGFVTGQCIYPDGGSSAIV